MRPIAAALLLLALCACASADTETDVNTPQLAGTSWRLVSLRGQPTLTQATVTLQFVDAQVAGSAGANRYFGSWSLEGGQLSFSEFGSTRMMGPDDVMDQERRYLTLLGSATAAHVQGDRLVLSRDGREELVFERDE